MKSHSTAATRKKKPHKIRLDLLIVQRQLAPSRERAQALLLAGQVRVDGAVMTKAGARVSAESNVQVVGEAMRYASRGGLKLEGALEDFGVTPQGKICLDVGSSTGGFTDCLLQNGATKVCAVDVTIDQLAYKLRQDSRVFAIERNARYLKSNDVGESVELVTMDVSFISVDKVLPSIIPLAAPLADFLVLIKPQFELEKHEVGKGGIVRDPALHQKAIDRVTKAAKKTALEIIGVKPSRITGTEGNQEFFLHARKQA